jgi:hypothetical protein
MRLGRDRDLRLRAHEMAGRMRLLGMHRRPLVTVHAERPHGPLGEFTAV